MILNKSQKTIVHFLLIVFILLGFLEVFPAQASQGQTTHQIPKESIRYSKEVSRANPASDEKNCQPNSGWMWANGPTMPDIATQVQKELFKKGINGSVEAKSFGEIDSCGTYSHRGVDFTLRLTDQASDNQASQQSLVDGIVPILLKHGTPNLGNVRLISKQGKRISVEIDSQQPIFKQRM